MDNSGRTLGVCQGALLLLVLLHICALTSAFRCYECSLAEKDMFTDGTTYTMQPCDKDLEKVKIATCRADIRQCITAEYREGSGNHTVWLRGCAVHDAVTGCETKEADGGVAVNCVCGTELCNTADGNYPGAALFLVPLSVALHKILIKE